MFDTNVCIIHYALHHIYIYIYIIKGKSNANGIIIFNSEILELTLNNLQLIQCFFPRSRGYNVNVFFHAIFWTCIEFIFLNSYIHTYIYSHIYGPLETTRALWLKKKLWIHPSLYNVNSKMKMTIIYIIYYSMFYIFLTDVKHM